MATEGIKHRTLLSLIFGEGQRGSTSWVEMQVPAEDVWNWRGEEASQAMMVGRIMQLD